MNVTVLSHVKSETSNPKNAVLIDQEAFTEEMGKLSTPSEANEKELLNLSEDISQSSDEKEGEKKLEEDESIAFTLLHPFLRLQTELDSLSKGEQLKTLHIETDPIDSQSVTEAALNTAETLGSAEKSLTEVTKITESVPAYSATNGAEMTESVSDPELIEKTRPLTSDSIAAETPDSPSFPAELVEESRDTEQKTEQALSVRQDSIDTDSFLEQDQMTNPQNSNKSITIEETRSTNEQSNESGPQIEAGSEKTLEDPAFSELETEPFSQLDESQPSADEMTREINLNSQVFDRQQVSQVAQSAEATQQPVTKEQSVEIIQDMMMTVMTDESGKEIFKSTLTLTPESLGEVKIELTYSEDGLSGTLVFESDETKKWMESQWQQFRQPLETKGLILDQFDFSVTEPAVLPQTDGDSFSQESDQSEDRSSRESNQSVLTQVKSEGEETSHLKPHSSTAGLNIYA